MHYCYHVIHDEDDDVDELLEPLSETNLDDAVFFDALEDYADYYANEEGPVLLLNGKEYTSYSITETPELFVEVDKDVYFSGVTGSKVHRYGKDGVSHYYALRDDIVVIQKPLTEIYETVEDMLEAFGYEYVDGFGYGYLYNENAIYDWYEIGGRWADTLHHTSGDKRSTLPIFEYDLAGARKSMREALLALAEEAKAVKDDKDALAKVFDKHDLYYGSTILVDGEIDNYIIESTTPYGVIIDGVVVNTHSTNSAIYDQLLADNAGRHITVVDCHE